MAFRTFCKIPSYISHHPHTPTPSSRPNSSGAVLPGGVGGPAMFLHKNRKYVIENRRNMAISCKPEPEPRCPDKTCNKKKKKKSFWKSLFESDDEPKKKPPIECCRVKFYQREDPDLSQFGGTAYKTCGRAYVIQKDLLPDAGPELSREDKILRRIETHPDLKDTLDEDPLPKYKNVPQRMIDVCDNKMHPLYRKLQCTPRAGVPKDGPAQPYRHFSGPINVEDIPLNIKFNKKLLEQKNLFSEFKRVEPPRQLVGKMIEMKKNEKPTLEYGSNRREKRADPYKKITEQQKKFVFETLKGQSDCL